jgi:hypothetical protein
MKRCYRQRRSDEPGFTYPLAITAVLNMVLSLCSLVRHLLLPRIAKLARL